MQINGITQPAQLNKLVLDLIQAPDQATVINLLTANGQKGNNFSFEIDKMSEKVYTMGII